MPEPVSINLADITFVQELKESEWSSIFQVRWHDKECVLKVFHSVERSLVPHHREIDVFKCESRAYSRLKARGVCQRGSVPDFYGVIEQIDPADWQPHLKRFLKDRLRPNAVLIEYVPNMRDIDIPTFSEYRIRRLREILAEIHDAGVYHADPYPRNMMVQENPERCLWIDFDCAQTFSSDSITPPHLQQRWMKEEDEAMDWFVDALTADYKEGKISRSWICYYGTIKPE